MYFVNGVNNLKIDIEYKDLIKKFSNISKLCFENMDRGKLREKLEH